MNRNHSGNAVSIHRALKSIMSFMFLLSLFVALTSALGKVGAVQSLENHNAPDLAVPSGTHLLPISEVGESEILTWR